jgi:phosphatidylglycerophosphate synthase
MPRGGRPGRDEYTARWSALQAAVDQRQLWAIRIWLRVSYRLSQGLARLGASPNALTGAGLVCSVAVPAVAVWRGGWLFAAAAFVVLAAVADSADGAVAVITDRSSRHGAFVDPVADRLSEALWLLGLWLVGAPGPLVTLCGALAWLHEYARARATVAGMVGFGTVTAAERPTRIILVVLALVLGGLVWFINPHLTPAVVTVVLAAWAIVGVLGLVRLTAAIRAALVA